VATDGSWHLLQRRYSADLGWPRLAGVLTGGDAGRLGPQASGFLHRLVVDALDRSMCWCQWVGAHEWEANGTSADNVRVQGRGAR
jgi:hypothetical protein